MCATNNSGKHTKPGSLIGKDTNDQHDSKEVEFKNKEVIDKDKGVQNVSDR